MIYTECQTELSINMWNKIIPPSYQHYVRCKSLAKDKVQTSTGRLKDNIPTILLITDTINNN